MEAMGTKQLRRTAIALYLLLSLAQPALPSSRAQRARGAADFVSAGCDHCHAIHQNGGHRGPDLSGVGLRKGKSAIRRQILYGSSRMPAFGDILSRDQVNDLVAYLRSCRDQTPPTPPSP
jgi:mono/diheme cytochrome c family protein